MIVNNELKVAGSPIFEIMTLTTVNGFKLDLKPLLVTMNIYEDIFSPVLTGNVTVMDALGLFDKIPLCGEETLTTKITSWDYANENEKVNFLHRTFDIIKITDIIQVNDFTKSYILHFASPELKQNEQIRISKSYSDISTSGVVAAIMTDDFAPEGIDPAGLSFPTAQYAGKDKASLNYLNADSTEVWYQKLDDNDSMELFVEKTRYKDPTISFPYMKPFEIINWLSSRSLRFSMGKNYGTKTESQAANFVFFESKRGFQFVSIDTLLEAKDLSTTRFGFGSALENKTSSGNRNVQSEKIEKLQIQNCYDIMKNLKSGMYASRLFTYDMATGDLNQHDYNYIESFDKTESTERTSSTAATDFPMIKSDDTDLSTRFLSRRILVSQNPQRGFDNISSTPTERNNASKDVTGVEEYLQGRVSQLMRLSNFRVLFDIAGNSKHKVGDMCFIDLKQWENNPQGGSISPTFKETSSKYYSGYYLITSIRHQISNLEYKMSIEATKDAYKTKIGNSTTK